MARPAERPVIYTLAHLSDLHATPVEPRGPGPLLGKRFFGWLSWRMRRHHEHKASVLEALLDDLRETTPDQVAITYTHESGATYWVEPTTGIVIDTQQQMVRTATIGGPGGSVLATMPVFNVDSRFTDGSVSAAASDANDRRNALNMVGSVTAAADLVVSDPVQAGTMAVMAIADTAQFDLARQRGRRY